MLQFHKILVPLDHVSENHEVLQIAIAFAQKVGVQTLHLLHVVPIGNMPFYNAETVYDQYVKSYQHEIVASESKKLEALAASLTKHDFKIEAKVTSDLNTAHCIKDYAEEQGIDLIVMGTHGRKGFDRFLVGSVAEKVVQLVPCPVLTIHQYEDHSSRWVGTQSILFPFDFSEASKEVWEVTKSLAATLNASILVVHVIEEAGLAPVYLPYWEMKIPMYEMSAYLRKQVDDFIREHGGGADVPYSIDVLHGVPSKELVRYINDKAPDLVVMATHGLTGLSHALIGSVTERVVRNSPTPILTLKPKNLDS
jgi:nucleotide-binding universal stress UspA family protein